MPRLLTTAAQLICPHAGTGTTTPSAPIVSIGAGIACVEGDTGVIAGCVQIPPCVSYTLQSMGLNATEISNKKAILETDFQVTNTGLPITRIETNDTNDESTPAPLAPGAGPAATPAMADLVAPIVVAAPPAATFVIHIGTPPVLPLVFTITSGFPLQWSLALLNGTTQQSQDATNGVPGLVVAPPGGGWQSPSLVVTATATAAFFSSLTPGLHALYMTAVSQRGLFGLGKVAITVVA